MAKFFIRRPIFAWVIAISIMLAGLLGIFTLWNYLAVSGHRTHHGAYQRHLSRRER